MNIDECNSGTNFSALAEELAPGGTQRGNEYVTKNPTRGDNHTGSFSINFESQKWADFADDAKGCGAVSLYAYLRQCDAGKALKDLATRIDGGMHPTRTDVTSAEPPERYPGRSDLPDHRWIYRDAAGEAVICIYRWGDGKTKTIRPMSRIDGKWIPKHLDGPRPLLMQRGEQFLPIVVIVEGEKAYDAARKIFAGKATVTTWCGGSSAGHIRRATWSQIPIGSRVTIWADADEPGKKAAQTIASELVTAGHSADLIRGWLPEGRPAGWDAADAGDDQNAIIAEMRAGLTTLPVSQTATLPARNDNVESPAPAAQHATADDTVVALGYDHGTYYYLSRSTQQVVALPAAGHTLSNLLQLAALDRLESEFAGKSGVCINRAADTLMSSCHSRGVFSRCAAVRGVGAWYDPELGPIVHTGASVRSGGADIDLADASALSQYVYERSRNRGEYGSSPATREDFDTLVDLAEELAVASRWQARALIAWCCIAPACGALAWRPHIWLTGAAGTGKSWLLQHVVAPLIQPYAVFAQGGSTEAGLRRELRTDALPVAIDEAESCDPLGSARMRKILELARGASSDTQAQIYMAAKDGGAEAFIIRSCICLASIGVNLQGSADVSRFTVVDIVQSTADQFTAIKAIARKIDADFARRIRCSILSQIPAIRTAAGHISDVITAECADRRQGDQIGTIAAAWSAVTGQIPDNTEAAAGIISALGWVHDSDARAETDDAQQCLDAIMTTVVLGDTSSGTTRRRSVGDLVTLASGGTTQRIDETTAEVTRSEAAAALRDVGITTDRERVYISSSHDGMRRILDRTAFATSWAPILARLPGADRMRPMRFGPVVTRAVSLALPTM